MVTYKQATQEFNDRGLLLDYLQKQGIVFKSVSSGWQGLCPFHNENTPSFYLYEDSQRYHCFGCQESGYITNYLIKKEGLSWKEAIEKLCELYNIPLESNNPEENKRIQKIKEQYKATEVLGKFFKEEFDNLDSYHPAKKQITDRGLSLTTTNYGYAPEDRNKVINYLKPYIKSGEFTANTLKELGYLKKGDNNNIYFPYKNRLMFYFKSQENKIEGFTGRALTKEDEKKRKYVNSNNSLIYNKSKEIYNYDKARKFINRTNQVYFVEGQFDVVAMIEAGYENTVAISGTAIDKFHINKINNSFKNKNKGEFILLLDSDSAGQKAVYNIFSKNPNIHRNLYIVNLPKGKDPCEYLGFNKEATLPEPILYTEYIFKSLKRQYQATIAKDPYNFIEDFATNYISKMQGTLRSNYITRLSSYCRVPIQTITAFLTKEAPTKEEVNSSIVKTDNYNTTVYDKATALLYINKPFFSTMLKELRISSFPIEYKVLIKNIFKTKRLNLESLIDDSNRQMINNILSQSTPSDLSDDELLIHYHSLLDSAEEEKKTIINTQNQMLLRANLEQAKTENDILQALISIEQKEETLL